MSYQIVLAHAYGCYACEKQVPLFIEASNKFDGVEFRFYNVDEDNWALADLIGIDGTPGFFLVEAETQTCIAVNNSGLLTVKEILEWITEEINNETAEQNTAVIEA